MRSLLGKKLANSVSSVGSMILFLLFAVCSLIIVAAGVSTYSRISDNFNSTFSSSAAVSYVTNKIRGGTGVVIGDGETGLTVYSDETACVIMNSGGGIAEKNIRASADITNTGGDVIFPKTMLVLKEEEPGLFSVSVVSGKRTYTALCRSKG